MTSEEMQKAMQFSVEQQAQTTVKMDRLTERVDVLAVAQDRNEKKWERTEEGIRTLLSIAEIHERDIASQGKQILALGETTRATDDRLNALINIVERKS